MVRRASPEVPYFDDVLHFALFEKLGAHSVSWMKDGRGDPRASGELMIRPIDLAKVGQVMLEGGTFRGARIVSSEWVQTLLAPGQPLTDECGLSGDVASFGISERRLSAWKSAGVDDATVAAVAPLVGRSFTTSEAAAAALADALGEARFAELRAAWATKLKMFDTTTNVKAYRADGHLGQYIVVVPSARLVAVRCGMGAISWDPKEFGYEDFRDDVMALAGVGRGARR